MELSSKGQADYYLAIVGLIVCVLFWVLNHYVGRSMYIEISPIALTFWRLVIAMSWCVLVGWRGLLKHKVIISQYKWFLARQAFLGFVVFNCLAYLAAHTTTVVNLNLVNAMTPILIFSLSVVWLGIIPKRMEWLGLGLAFAGFIIVITVGEPLRILNMDLNPGDLWMFVAVFSWSIYSVLHKRSSCRLPLGTSLLVQIIMAALIMIPLYLVDFFLNGGFQITPKITLALAYVGIFPSVVSIYLWNHGVNVLGPNLTSMFLYLAPIFAAVIGVVLLGETLAWHHIVGEILIVAGFYFAIFHISRSSQPKANG
ncbi:MAG: DMT family transporter [Arenicellaceae bacterium]|nr:DMT family transporter [Arenicellaceae bacterium]